MRFKDLPILIAIGGVVGAAALLGSAQASPVVVVILCALTIAAIFVVYGYFENRRKRELAKFARRFGFANSPLTRRGRRWTGRWNSFAKEILATSPT